MALVPRRIGFLWSLLKEARLAVRLLREPRVPALAKALPLLALAYVVTPVDLVPDFIAVLGQVDDITLLVTAIALFRRLIPSHLVAYHESAVARRRHYAPMPSDEDAIDAEWKPGGDAGRA